MHKVAVYGSLKRGFGNHRLIEGQTFINNGFTMNDGYTMYSLGAFPGVVEDGDSDIQVELYEVDDAGLERLDRLEGHPTFYCRKQVNIVGRDDSVHYAWMYIYQGETGGLPLVATGDWQ